jgi:hypothetical protein
LSGDQPDRIRILRSPIASSPPHGHVDAPADVRPLLPIPEGTFGHPPGRAGRSRPDGSGTGDPIVRIHPVPDQENVGTGGGKFAIDQEGRGVSPHSAFHSLPSNPIPFRPSQSRSVSLSCGTDRSASSPATFWPHASRSTDGGSSAIALAWMSRRSMAFACRRFEASLHGRRGKTRAYFPGFSFISTTSRTLKPVT